MYVDVKVTTWQRVQLPESLTKEQVIETLKGCEPSVNDLWDLDENLEYQPLFETEEYITVSQNDEIQTVELFDDNDVMIWNNAENKN